MTTNPTPVSSSTLAIALAAAGVTVTPVPTEQAIWAAKDAKDATQGLAPIGSLDRMLQAANTVAKPARIKPLPYSDAQAFAFWKARTNEDKAGALWSAIAPMLSAYLVNGGSTASLKNAKGAGALASHIHTNKTRKDKAAQGVFAMVLADYKPRQCELSQDDHDTAMLEMESVFTVALLPATSAVRKPQADRYTVAQFIEALGAGQFDDETIQAIAQAVPASVRHTVAV